MRYFITLSYDGTRYHGWQIQPNGISVQGELQRCLSLLLRREVEITGAGRTDAGVHARMMVAHFDWEDVDCSDDSFKLNDSEHRCTSVIDTSQLTYKLNRLLPFDIAVQRIEPVTDNKHARFSATSRTYHYYIHTVKSPFLRHYSCEMHYPLDFQLMNEAADMLLGYDDFGCFCKSHTDVKTTICKITTARWHQVAEYEWYFEITANRFLRNMVRAIVGTLVDVGRHRLALDDFRKVIEGRKRSDAGESMPGNALFLESVTY